MSNIKSAKYENSYLKDEVTLGHKNIIVDYGDFTVCMIEDDNNDSRFYQEVLTWVAEGNTIEPADE